jgi:rhamnosyltransferase
LRLNNLKDSPKVSLLIRNLNERKNLEILFPILNSQEYKNFEVIFLDSGSTDGSIEFIQNFDSKFDIIVDSITKEEFTFGRALNVCSKLAVKPDYLITLSAHCFPLSEHFISNYVNNFLKYNCDIVYGSQVGYKHSMLSEASHLKSWFDDNYGIKNPSPFSNNGNCGYKFTIWEEFKFDENLTGCEDIELASRAIEKGRIIAYGENIGVSHYHEEDFEQIYFRYYREALALNSIFSFRYTIIRFLKNIINESLTDLLYKYKNKGFVSRSIVEILKYRYFKNLGHYRGFKKKKEISNLKLFSYSDSKDEELRRHLFAKYFY